MSDLNIFRVKCADGTTFEPVEAYMSNLGTVRIYRDNLISVALPPSAGCMIEQVLPRPAPPVSAAPDALTFALVLGGVVAAGVAIVAALSRASFPMGSMYVPPPNPIPPPPKPPGAI